jgi:hypothetical protein
MNNSTLEFLNHLSTETLLLIMMAVQHDIDWGYYSEDYGDINIAQAYIDHIVGIWQSRPPEMNVSLKGVLGD